uniref:Uncharacterized protein n=1 Tax=Branchiostoma floridae TaxID=7739 RepID=C3Y3D8_BRAFL|eukprot:XP_002609195.1 hypothetical protein BRAFLDRAFT_90648 [Branchiostoma floridae]
MERLSVKVVKPAPPLMIIQRLQTNETGGSNKLSTKLLPALIPAPARTFQLRPTRPSSDPHGPALARTDSSSGPHVLSSGPHVPAPARTDSSSGLHVPAPAHTSQLRPARSLFH